MKKILALLMTAVLVMLCIPAAAVAPRDVNPVGQNIANVHAAYITEGGNPSTTDFLTSADFASHTITIINVWSNGCGPCINEMPYFQQVHEEYGDQGVLIVGCCSLWINGSFSGEWNWLQSHNYTYMNVIQDDVLYGLYSQNNYVPQSFVIDSEGNVIDFIGGGTTYQFLKNTIDRWLAYYSDEYYTVSYLCDATNEIFETQTVHGGYAPEYPTPPEVEGYSFSNWNPSTPPYIMQDTTITAHYTRNTYRVRFYDSITGEKIGNNVYVQHGDPVPDDKIPDPPVHAGYTFVGWDHDLTCVTEAMDVYTIYEGGGSGTPGDLDGDGEITVTDALATLRAAMGLTQLTDGQNALADLDGDGQVTVSDALIILRRAMGIA